MIPFLILRPAGKIHQISRRETRKNRHSEPTEGSSRMLATRYIYTPNLFSFSILSPIERRLKRNVLLFFPTSCVLCVFRASYVHADPSVDHTRVLKAAPKGRGVPRDRASNLIRNGATPALCTNMFRRKM